MPTEKHIIEQETEILRCAIDRPGFWKVGTISKKLGIPRTTTRSRLRHLRAVGYLERQCHSITPTESGLVVYQNRKNNSDR